MDNRIILWTALLLLVAPVSQAAMQGPEAPPIGPTSTPPPAEAAVPQEVRPAVEKLAGVRMEPGIALQDARLQTILWLVQGAPDAPGPDLQDEPLPTSLLPAMSADPEPPVAVHPWSARVVTPPHPAHAPTGPPSPAEQGSGDDATRDATLASTSATLTGPTGLAAAATGAGLLVGLAVLLARLLPWPGILGLSRSRAARRALEHPHREALFRLIQGRPGIPVARLREATGMGNSTVTYHLRRLEQTGVVVSKRHGRSRHFYENGGTYGRQQKDRFAVLQNDRTRQIATFVSRRPGSIQKDIRTAMGISSSLAVWHMKRLQAAGIVVARRRGRAVHYYPADRRIAPLSPSAGPAATAVPA